MMGKVHKLSPRARTRREHHLRCLWSLGLRSMWVAKCKRQKSLSTKLGYHSFDIIYLTRQWLIIEWRYSLAIWQKLKSSRNFNIMFYCTIDSSSNIICNLSLLSMPPTVLALGCFIYPRPTHSSTWHSKNQIFCLLNL